MSRTNIFSRCEDLDAMRVTVAYFERARLVVDELRREAESPAELLAVADVFDTVERWRQQAIAHCGRLVAAQKRAELAA